MTVLYPNNKALTQDQQKAAQEVLAEHLGWVPAVATGDVKAVQNRYHSEGSLFLPTNGANLTKTFNEVGEYHEHFTGRHDATTGKANPPKGEYIGDMKASVSKDGSMVVVSGKYRFDGTTEAEYTFAYKKNNEGQWKIVHHHSAADPLSEAEVKNSGVSKIGFTEYGADRIASNDGSLAVFVRQDTSAGFRTPVVRSTVVTMKTDGADKIVDSQFSVPPKGHAPHHPSHGVKVRGPVHGR